MIERFVRPSSEDYDIPIGTYDMSDYLFGDCEYFAKALHDEFGYPIYSIRNADEEKEGLYNEGACIHVFCISGDGYVDARGTTPFLQEFCEPYEDLCDWTNISVNTYSETPWVNELNGSGKIAYENARKFIREHKEMYQSIDSMKEYKVILNGEFEENALPFKTGDLDVCIEDENVLSWSFHTSVNAANEETAFLLALEKLRKADKGDLNDRDYYESYNIEFIVDRINPIKENSFFEKEEENEISL